MRSDKPILTLVDEFLANQDIMKNSRQKYRDNMNIFITWLSINGDVRNPLRSDIIRYKEYLVNKGRTAQTVDNYLSAVRQFFRYLEQNDIYENISAGVRSPRMSKEYRKDHLTQDQVCNLLSSIDRSSTSGKRDYAIINLMVRTGMRCVEVCRLDFEDINVENNQWVIAIQGKGRTDKDRILGITDKIVDPIREYLQERDYKERDPLFVNHSIASHDTRIREVTISMMVKKRLRAIGINSPKISAHSLRHTAAVTALTAGASVYDVQQMLGHRDVKATSIYLLSIAQAETRKGTAVRLLDKAFNLPEIIYKNNHLTMVEHG